MHTAAPLTGMSLGSVTAWAHTRSTRLFERQRPEMQRERKRGERTARAAVPLEAASKDGTAAEDALGHPLTGVRLLEVTLEECVTRVVAGRRRQAALGLLGGREPGSLDPRRRVCTRFGWTQVHRRRVEEEGRL